MNGVLIAGGDIRYIRLAEIFAGMGADVFICGSNSEFINNKKIRSDLSFSDAVKDTNLIVLPIPASRDGLTVSTPLSDDKLYLSDIYENALPDAIVVGGIIDTEEFKKHSVTAYDYTVRDDFACMNAAATCEGALLHAMQITDITVSGSKSLVTGFGRIAQIMAKTLAALGSEVTVCARSNAALSLAAAYGYKIQNLTALSYAVQNCDFIFNTVPSLLFDLNVLLRVGKKCPIIDLASAPGGVDFASADSLGINAALLPGIPGKYSPQTAAETIAEVIFNIICESGKDASTWICRA